MAGGDQEDEKKNNLNFAAISMNKSMKINLFEEEEEENSILE